MPWSAQTVGPCPSRAPPSGDPTNQPGISVVRFRKFRRGPLRGPAEKPLSSPDLIPFGPAVCEQPRATTGPLWYPPTQVPQRQIVTPQPRSPFPARYPHPTRAGGATPKRQLFIKRTELASRSLPRARPKGRGRRSQIPSIPGAVYGGPPTQPNTLWPDLLDSGAAACDGPPTQQATLRADIVASRAAIYDGPPEQPAIPYQDLA